MLTSDGNINADGIDIEINNGLNNSSSGADGSEGLTVDGAGAVCSFEEGDIGSIFRSSRECGVEVGGISIQVSESLNNFSSGAIDGSQGRTVDGAGAVGGL